MLKYIFFLLFVLVACSTKPTRSPHIVSQVPSVTDKVFTTDFTVLPGWNEQKFTDTLPGLLQSCRVMAKRLTWNEICAEAVLLAPDDELSIRHFFESRFVPWKIKGMVSEEAGLITGYYEPLLKGSTVYSERTPWPVYGVPDNLLTLDVPVPFRNQSVLIARRVGEARLAIVPGVSSPRAGEIIVRTADFPADGRGTLKGRLEGNSLVPYYTRAEISRVQGVNVAPVLAWVEDPIELFFMHIQGTGRIQLDDGRLMRLGYADNNGHPYQSIGRWLADNGEIPLSKVSMQNIQQWTKKNSHRLQALLNVNPRYIFFKAADNEEEGPVGALGVPLTDGYSIAVDPAYIPLGTPVYLVTTWPLSSQPLNRVVHAQDTGSAIRGPGRADLFWGLGSDAGRYAGRMKQSGSLWMLLPRGIQPS